MKLPQFSKPIRPTLVIAGIVALTLVLSACAGPNAAEGVNAAAGQPLAGFWGGLWHGMIAPIAFVISLFKDSVSMYEVHNTGGWYDFGFLAGLSFIWGGSAVSLR